MRRMLYLGLTEALKELRDESGQPLIRHIDLWNEQVEFIEQEEPFDTPAVFIEFLVRAVAHVKRNRPAGRRSVPAACGHQMERKRKGRKHVSGGIAGTL